MLKEIGEESARPRPPPRIKAANQNTAKYLGTGEVKNGQSEERIFDLSALVEACPDALTTKSKDGRTPYQEREHTLLNDSTVKKFVKAYTEKKDSDGGTKEAREARAKRFIIVKDPIAHYLISYCVHKSKSREETMKRLYKPGQERHIEFDLAGLPTAVIKAEYLKQLERHLKFESILKYVALPVLSVESQPVKRHGSMPQTELHRNGRSDLVAIFEWLWQRGVREIIKVMVIDNGHPPHASGAIVDALYGFEIKEWDWKRIDLCSDVISESSLAVREVSLYSSGNEAVLMGWASEEGLGNREKFPHLEKVNLYVQEGLEDNEGWKWNNRRCEENIIKHGGKGPNGKAIKVEIIADNNLVNFSSELSTTKRIEESPSWIKSVRDFSSFLMNSSMAFDRGKKVPPVKIAIIDDGIDATMYDVQSKIAGGVTFCPWPYSADLVNSYFVPRGKHGTLMAQLICDMCSGAQLYIARLEEIMTSTGSGRRITPSSAAKAVEWAVSCGVNIISMSWTIQNANVEDEDMKQLKAAIDSATKARILMFCSASDQGANSNGHCYPGAWDQCIRIGGATFTGEKLTWVDNNIDFSFPGRNVPFLSKDGKSVVYESGSSVATAAASGLAGVLIYSARLLNANNPKYEADVFQDRNTMKTAFRNMARADGKFPQTERILNKTFKKNIQNVTKKPRTIDIDVMSWTEGDEEFKALENLLNQLQDE